MQKTHTDMNKNKHCWLICDQVVFELCKSHILSPPLCLLFRPMNYDQVAFSHFDSTAKKNASGAEHIVFETQI